MSDLAAHVVILGAGHAGGTAAALLRQYGYEGAITLVGAEPIPPYQRPPLSKAWLKGEADADSLALKPLEFYAEHNIDFRASTTAVGINRGAKTVGLSDGSTVSYDALIIATGARAIALPIPGADLSGVMFLRTAADAETLKATVGPGKTLAVVGGGYIGLEVAASGRALGAEVVVLEREDRLLARVACKTLSTFFKTQHEAHGVSFELSATATAFEGNAAGQVTGVRLADGRLIPCDAVVVGVGAHPNDELARDCGLETARGVVADLEARTSDPAIFAIGDVAHRPMPIYDRMFRMESVPNALEGAKQAASAIVGRSPPPGEVPWQWSDQYDLKLQIAGYAFDVDEILLRGDPASGKFAVFHLKGDLVQSVEAINSPPEFMMGKQLIGARRPVDKARLADPSISMKEVAA
ncbi:MAG TPA: FAD-dependent oxidoreductase [Phenylobacterium sp.]|jgi:3-phenylpropionate/trans-cinnamate dioxygenase ferredoxin reductase subunit|nr:FAD-dependent oxidoreductase [Phenylobacterium sp.]